MKKVAIIGAARTPMGRFQGGLSDKTAVELGALVVREAIARSKADVGSPDQTPLIDEVIMGSVLSAGLGQGPARQVALAAGVPSSVSCLTINKLCGSGLKAVMLGAQAISLGDANIIVAGGMESMSNAPYLLAKARSGYRMGHGEVLDSMICDGLWCSWEDWHMGCAADYIAEKFGVSREEQDEFAYNSHRKAIAAIEGGELADEIIPVEIKDKKGVRSIENDESPRQDTNLEKLASLRPIFKEDGVVTAGNSSCISDGAAAVVVASSDAAEKLGVEPLATIVAYVSSGVAPKEIFYAPVLAIKEVLAKSGLRLDEIDLIEINEAFAAQVLVDGKTLEWDWNKVNVNGGAIALGHPIGASGARILVTLLFAMKKAQARHGLAALCLGGGGAVAMIVERT